MSVLGGCQILTLEAPLVAEKAPCMYNGYIQYSKDDVCSPFVKPPCFKYSTYLTKGQGDFYTENNKKTEKNQTLKLVNHH
jgi:hypothetical protein